MVAVAEYNVYGVALTNPKWQIDEAQAAQMYGFKAWLWLNSNNCIVQLQKEMSKMFQNTKPIVHHARSV